MWYRAIESSRLTEILQAPGPPMLMLMPVAVLIAAEAVVLCVVPDMAVELGPISIVTSRSWIC